MVPHRTIIALLCMCVLGVSAALLASARIGAVVQSWTYDPTHNPPLVTLKIVNNSHKDITALNISIKEAYANGRVDKHEMLEEFLGKILLVKEAQGTANEAN